MISSILTITSCLVCTLGAFILFRQGQWDLLTGKLAIAACLAALIWFLLRWIRSPLVRARPWRAAAIAGVTSLVAYGIAVATIYRLQDSLLFVPVLGRFSQCENQKRFDYEIVDTLIDNGKKRIRSYVHRDPQAQAWMLVFHGNAESACDSFQYSVGLADLPLNFALVEYPGYQDDPILPTQDGLLLNAAAAYDFLTADSPKLPVFEFGRSLGTGVATYVAAERRSQGLILISPYTSIADVGAFEYPLIPVHWLMRNPFPAFEWAPKVTALTLVVHGNRDRTIPISLGKSEAGFFPHLFQFVEVPGGAHNDLMADSDGPAWRSIRNFMGDQLRQLSH